MTTDVAVQNLIINKLTKQQYQGITTPSDTELYMVTDEVISSSDVTTALGYTPYDSSNPSGYTSNVGTVTSVNNVSPVNGNVSLSIPTVNNATLTITQGGTAKGTFTANASSNVTIDLDAGGGGSVDVDNKSITTNSSDEIQTVGVINSRDSSTAIKTWTGTKAQYDAITTKDSSTLYNITDDTDVSLTILEALYPVGSVYITTANTCPLSTLISGSTWELVSSGRVLQGADSGHTAGTTIEAGLPDFDVVSKTSQTIQGTTAPAGTKLTGVSGSFGINTSGTSYGNTNPAGMVLSGSALTAGTDFGASSSIYGNSSTVQPPAYVVNIYRRTA